jgi:cephalosporin-C deacetylase
MPLTFDLPLEQLDDYRGRNPRPADFDAYWDTGLAEMHALDPQVELTPAEFETPFADCFHLRFTGVGGARIHAKMVRPKGIVRPGPAALYFHGYTARIGDWTDEMMLGLAAAGITCVGLDVRGQGGLSEDVGGVQGNTHHGHIVRGLQQAIDGDPTRLLFRSIFLDTAQLARIVMAMPEVDPDRVGAWGRSQGGALTLACAALEPRIRRLAPTNPFLSDYRRVWEMDLAKDAYQELTTWLRSFDPLHEREAAVFEALGYIDVQHLAPRIRGETLWGIGLMDQICPPSTQFAGYNRLPGEKRMRMYPDYAHEKLPGLDDEIYRFFLGM